MIKRLVLSLLPVLFLVLAGCEKAPEEVGGPVYSKGSESQKPV